MCKNNSSSTSFVFSVIPRSLGLPPSDPLPRTPSHSPFCWTLALCHWTQRGGCGQVRHAHRTSFAEANSAPCISACVCVSECGRKLEKQRNLSVFVSLAQVTTMTFAPPPTRKKDTSAITVSSAPPSPRRRQQDDGTEKDEEIMHFASGSLITLYSIFFLLRKYTHNVASTIFITLSQHCRGLAGGTAGWQAG